jgi:hypothetical protein
LGERRYSSHSFLTSASRPGRALPPVSILQEAGLAPLPVFQFPKYHKKLFHDFSARGRGRDILKGILGNESIRETRNDNGDRAVNFAATEGMVVKSTVFPHRKIKYS